MNEIALSNVLLPKPPRRLQALWRRSQAWRFRAALTLFLICSVLMIVLATFRFGSMEVSLLAGHYWAAALAFGLPMALLYIGLPLLLYWPRRQSIRLARFDFQRLGERWGRAGAVPDFDDYLRYQLSSVLEAVSIDPQAARTDALLKYIARLMSDRYERHEIQVRVTLPNTWEIPLSWFERDGQYLFDRWITVKTHDSKALEIAYQSFAADTNIVYIRPI